MGKMILSIIMMTLFHSGFAEANATASKTVFKPKTEHNFTGISVSGRYQTPLEAVITIEDEKVLDDLLGARTNFKDRLKKQGGMR